MENKRIHWDIERLIEEWEETFQLKTYSKRFRTDLLDLHKVHEILLKLYWPFNKDITSLDSLSDKEVPESKLSIETKWKIYFSDSYGREIGFRSNLFERAAKLIKSSAELDSSEERLSINLDLTRNPDLILKDVEFLLLNHLYKVRDFVGEIEAQETERYRDLNKYFGYTPLEDDINIAVAMLEEELTLLDSAIPVRSLDNYLGNMVYSNLDSSGKLEAGHTQDRTINRVKIIRKFLSERI